MISHLKVITLFLLVALVFVQPACQQGTHDESLVRFHQKSELLLKRIVSKYAAASTRRGANASSRGVWEGDEEDIGSPRPMPRSPDSMASECLEMIEQLPLESRYYFKAVFMAYKCAKRILQRRNPFLSYGYNNLPQNSQSQYLYSMTPEYMGPYSQPAYDQNYFGDYNQYAGGGGAFSGFDQ